jgi:titin
VISGNHVIGIRLPSNQNLLEGNLVGTTATGLAPLDNGAGIFITGNSNTVGGTTAGARNIISSNLGTGFPVNFGISIDGQYGPGTGSYSLVESNYIGTDITGTVRLSQSTGIQITGDYNTIGGTTAAAGNVISGNSAPVFIFTSGLSFADGFGNAILDNYIGTDASGTQGFGSQYGVYVAQGANNNAIGGTTAGAGNTIAHCGTGVNVDSGTGDSILGHSIFSNTSGILLNSANNANNNQAAPVLTGASTSSTSTAITGTLQSVANTTFRIEFFSNQGLDASGNAEGQTFLGFATVAFDASGNPSSPDGSATVTENGSGLATFTATRLAAIPAGQGYLTATATNLNTGDTSQFSNYLTAPDLDRAHLLSQSVASESVRDFHGHGQQLVRYADGQCGLCGHQHRHRPGHSRPVVQRHGLGDRFEPGARRARHQGGLRLPGAFPRQLQHAHSASRLPV